MSPKKRAPQYPELAARIQAQRFKIGLSLSELSQRTGLSKGYLSRIENARMTPPLDTLARLARALESDLHSLLRPSPTVDGHPYFDVLLQHERPQHHVDADGVHLRCERLNRVNGRERLESLLLTLPASTASVSLDSDRSDQLMFVVDGELEWQARSALYRLGRGDTVYLAGDLHHSARAVEGTATLLLVRARNI